MVRRDSACRLIVIFRWTWLPSLRRTDQEWRAWLMAMLVCLRVGRWCRGRRVHTGYRVRSRPPSVSVKSVHGSASVNGRGLDEFDALSVLATYKPFSPTRRLFEDGVSPSATLGRTLLKVFTYTACPAVATMNGRACLHSAGFQWHIESIGVSCSLSPGVPVRAVIAAALAVRAHCGA